MTGDDSKSIDNYDDLRQEKYPELRLRWRIFLHNLRMGPISWSVILHYAEKACQGQAL
jgi:hypothetical protein